MPNHYVLLIEHGDGDLKPHDVSVHGSLAEAEQGLRDYAHILLVEGVGLCRLPTDESLIEHLMAAGDVDVRIFECSADGDNVYVEPFATPKAA